MDFCRKVYIHSSQRTLDSASSSDFRITLKRNVALPKRCAAYVSDIGLPHSWYAIDSHSDSIVFSFERVNIITWHVVKISKGNYTGAELAILIAFGMNGETTSSDCHILTDYIDTLGNLRIQMLHPLSGSWQYSLNGVDYGEHFIANTGADSWYIKGPQFTASLQYHHGYLETSAGLVESSVNKLVLSGGGQLLHGTYDSAGVFTPTFRPDATFRIYTDHEIRHGRVIHEGLESNVPPISLDYEAPATINEILRHSGISTDYDCVDDPFFLESTSGFLDLLGNSTPLYITSPELTSFDSSQDPRGESTIIRRIADSADFGDMIHDRGFYELGYFVCASPSIMTLSFKLQQQHGKTVNPHWAEWSFSLIFQELGG